MRVRGPVLALDYGARRIGLAISDADGTFAFPAGTLASVGRSRDLEALQELVAERGVQRIVVGLPIHLSGRKGETAQAAEEFANAVANKTGLPVEMLDERWSTRAAERSLGESKSGRRRRREAVDTAAATLLLQTWLERARNLADDDADDEPARSEAESR
jgi:putative Holliday junction resolvase